MRRKNTILDKVNQLTLNTIYNEDCVEGLNKIPNNSVDLVLTDIPYGEVNRTSGGLRNLNKDKADIVNFDLAELTRTLCNKTKGSIYMFCGIEQISIIASVMRELEFSTRLMTWEKTNPSPMNGQRVWLSASEFFVYGKRKGATFNEHCQSNVLHYPTQKGNIHPTMKPVSLFERLVTASTNEGEIVLDAFMGSGTTAIACINTNRNYIGFELDKEYYDSCCDRISNHKNPKQEKSNNYNMKTKQNIIEKVMTEHPADTILDKVINEHNELHQLCGNGEFLKVIYDLYNTTEAVMDNEVAKSFLKVFANVNSINWSDAVEYLYYIMKEAFPNFYEKNSADLDWDNLRSEDNIAYSMFLKGNEKYACKQLFELFCKRANIDIEGCIRESLMDAFGWKRVIKTLGMYVMEEYFSVEERYENADVMVEETEEEETTTETLEIGEDSTEDIVPSMPTDMEKEHKEETPLEIVMPSTTETEHSKDVITAEMIPSKEKSVVYGKKAEKAICIDDGSTRIFNSRKEMAEELDIDYSSITNYYRGQRACCTSKKDGKKYKFEKLYYKVKNGIILMVESSTKDIVESYKTVKEASRKWDIKYDKLQSILNNKTAEHHIYEGYEWWKEEDYKKQYKAVA